MVEMPRYETCCLQTGIVTQVTETGQQLPPSYGFKGVLEVSHFLLGQSEYKP